MATNQRPAEELMARFYDATATAGEQDAALRELIDQVNAPLRELIEGLTRRAGPRFGDLVDDVLASVWVSVLNTRQTGCGRFDPARGNCRAWLYTIAQNRLVSLISQRRESLLHTGDPASAPARQPADTPARLALLQFRDAATDTELAALSLWEGALGHLPSKRLMATMGLNAGVVSQVLARGLARFRAALCKQGVDRDDLSPLFRELRPGGTAVAGRFWPLLTGREYAWLRLSYGVGSDPSWSQHRIARVLRTSDATVTRLKQSCARKLRSYLQQNDLSLGELLQPAED